MFVQIVALNYPLSYIGYPKKSKQNSQQCQIETGPERPNFYTTYTSMVKLAPKPVRKKEKSQNGKRISTSRKLEAGDTIISHRRPRNLIHQKENNGKCREEHHNNYYTKNNDTSRRKGGTDPL